MISVEPGRKGRPEQEQGEGKGEGKGEEREGKFSISIKIRNEEIQQSPIKFEIRSISNENTFSMINGKEIHEKPRSPIMIEPGKPFEFEIISVDQFGSKMEKGGAIFDHSFEPPFPDAQVIFFPSHFFLLSFPFSIFPFPFLSLFSSFNQTTKCSRVFDALKMKMKMK